MKKLICLLALCAYLFTNIVFPFTAPVPVRAQTGEYACILQNDTYFYATQDVKRGLFILPKSYYVKVLDRQTDFCKIEYLFDDEHTKKLTGYARTDALTFVDYTPQTPYFYKLFDATYTLDGSVGGDGFLDEIRLTCSYYGDYAVGSTLYCYVLRGGEFGYIPKPDFLIPTNTEYSDRQQSSAEDTPVVATPKEDGASPAQIAIIIALCLLIPVLSALVLRQPKTQPYDED